jgi:hypothetical protein
LDIRNVFFGLSWPQKVIVISLDTTYIHTYNHSFSLDCASVLTTEPNCVKRKVKEAIEVKKKKPSLNRDGGCELPSVYIYYSVDSRQGEPYSSTQ